VSSPNSSRVSGHQAEAVLDPAPRRELTSPPALEIQPPVEGNKNAGGRRQGAWSAGAVRSDHREDVALLSVKRHAAHRFDLARRRADP